jgi:hypothetical protein
MNSGIKYKENALVNPKDAFLSGQGRGLALKQEAQMTDVEQIQPPQIPPSMFQLSESLSREVQEISGVNEELLGSATDEKAGILSMLRQGAGLTTLQILFDHLDFAQKALGKLTVDIIQANFTPGKVKRIIEDEPTPQFYNKAFGKYDTAIEEGLNTTTQKQERFAQLIHLRETGVQIPDKSLLEASTLQGKKELIKAVDEAAQQAVQQEELQTKITLEETQARTNLAYARAEADRGLGMERISRIEENEAFAIERRAEAEKDHYAGVLNLVKALKEIEDVDLSQIQKMIELAHLVDTNDLQKQQAQSGPIASIMKGRGQNGTSISGLAALSGKSPQMGS